MHGHSIVDVPQADANTHRLRKAVEDAGGEWKEVSRLSEHQLAELIRNDRIDILVELTGHTANNRLGVMALKPAPIQVWKPLLPAYARFFFFFW